MRNVLVTIRARLDVLDGNNNRKGEKKEKKRSPSPGKQWKLDEIPDTECSESTRPPLSEKNVELRLLRKSVNR